MVDIEEGYIPEDYHEDELEHEDCESDFQESSPFYVYLPFILAGVVALIFAVVIFGAYRGWFTKSRGEEAIQGPGADRMENEVLEAPLSTGEPGSPPPGDNDGTMVPPDGVELNGDAPDGEQKPGLVSRVKETLKSIPKKYVAIVVGVVALIGGTIWAYTAGLFSKADEGEGEFMNPFYWLEKFYPSDYEKTQRGRNGDPSEGFLGRSASDLAADTGRYLGREVPETVDTVKGRYSDATTDLGRMMEGKEMLDTWSTGVTSIGTLAGLTAFWCYYDKLWSGIKSLWHNWLSPWEWWKRISGTFNFLVVRNDENGDSLDGEVTRTKIEHVKQKNKERMKKIGEWANNEENQDTADAQLLLDEMKTEKYRAPTNVPLFLYPFTAIGTLYIILQIMQNFLPAGLAWVIHLTSPNALIGYYSTCFGAE